MTPVVDLPPSPSAYPKLPARALLFFIVLAVSAAAFFVLRPSTPAALVQFQVRKGISAREVARELESQGLSASAGAFFSGQGMRPQGYPARSLCDLKPRFGTDDLPPVPEGPPRCA